MPLLSYKDAGVDIDAETKALVEIIKPLQNQPQ